MTTGSSQDVLWIPLAELGCAGVIAPQLPDNAAAAVRALDDGMAAVEANGALVCVILSPVAWQKIQATNTAWQRLFHWALRHIDTPTLRRMAATADTVLDRHPDRSAPWRQA
jgi:hypothetical protein